ncbi:hypothetical protein JW935_08240 [candidate division KSB1 bacterium]|nr:hypothetical protein [candidate division KSB1 bacterium]
MKTIILLLLLNMLAWGKAPVFDSSDSLKTADVVSIPGFAEQAPPAFPGVFLARPAEFVFIHFDNARAKLNSTPAGSRFLDIVIPKGGDAGFAPDYSRRAGFGFNYSHKNLFFPASHFFIGSRIGYHSRQKHTLFFRKLPFGKSGLYLNTQLDYLRYTFEFYFGHGPTTKYADRMEYCHEKGDFTLALGRDIVQNGSLLLISGIEHHYTGPGREGVSPSLSAFYSQETLEGFQQNINFNKAGLLLHIDTRKQLWYPLSGYWVHAGVDYYDRRNTPQDEFFRVFSDLRAQTSVSRNKILAFRIAGNFLKPVNRHRIPFYMLSELGHTDTVRGIIRGRYRANHMVLASVEYRYWIARTLWGVLFVDTGQVADKFPDGFQRRLFCTGYGVGFRLKLTELIFYRINLGFSKDGFQLYVHVGEK